MRLIPFESQTVHERQIYLSIVTLFEAKAAHVV